MAFGTAPFDSEAELEAWVKSNLHQFFHTDVTLDGFRVTTPSGKHGVPDGFAFDFSNKRWFIVEAELLRHGVWDHIAEQIVRFVVATKSPETLRRIRNKVLDELEHTNKLDTVTHLLETSTPRLAQALELFIEGTPPEIAIFIDDTNQDLRDLAEALGASTSIFKISKFLVDGQAKYFSPDGRQPSIQTDRPPESGESANEYDAVKLLGDGEVVAAIRRFKAYRLSDGTVIHVKRSKYYPETNSYWYGIMSSSLEHIRTTGVTHIAFVLGEAGVAKVPVGTVESYLSTAPVTNNPDGEVRHYHIYIAPPPAPALYSPNDRIDVREHFVPFE